MQNPIVWLSNLNCVHTALVERQMANGIEVSIYEDRKREKKQNDKENENKNIVYSVGALVSSHCVQFIA